MLKKFMDFTDLTKSISGDRVTLYRPRVGDGQAVFEAVVESLKALREFPSSQPWALRDPSVAASEHFCEIGIKGHMGGTDFPFLIFREIEGTSRSRLIGCCGLHRPKWDVPSFEIGYWCRASEMRQGYATEAAQTLLTFAMSVLGAQRVVITTDAMNHPSRKIAERIGMKRDGVLRNYWREQDGTLRNAIVYSAVPNDVDNEHPTVSSLRRDGLTL